MKSLFFEFLSVLAVVATIDGASNVELVCPEGFFSLGDSCYLVYSQRSVWDEAQTLCGSLAAGGRLVEFETEAELALVKTHLTEIGFCGGQSGNSGNSETKPFSQKVEDAQW
ncbi:unnamed protein product [Cyprideis torosa]|uniref:Uncharacterized protein n=1 Tax=Cyprideis torosa TaxID=163714 RepID=A0A7R8ZPP3_9CRUS|nr:unnamed protein product [Cyprideis torosa]CAG0890305.1 unnamed protein product [Cyprideis torosa]